MDPSEIDLSDFDTLCGNSNVSTEALMSYILRLKRECVEQDAQLPEETKQQLLEIARKHGRTEFVEKIERNRARHGTAQ